MLMPGRVVSRMLGLNGPDMARGPEVARPCLVTDAKFLLRILAVLCSG